MLRPPAHILARGVRPTVPEVPHLALQLEQAPIDVGRADFREQRNVRCGRITDSRPAFKANWFTGLRRYGTLDDDHGPQEVAAADLITRVELQKQTG
jgi:hypothetical protein